MNTEREVVVLSAVRTAIGKYGGSLKDHPPTDLAATVVRVAKTNASAPVSDEDADHLAKRCGIVVTAIGD